MSSLTWQLQRGLVTNNRVACSAATYLLDWEVINLLLVMTSTQLYTPTATAQTNAHPFTSALLEQEDLVPALLQVCILSILPICLFHHVVDSVTKCKSCTSSLCICPLCS